MTTCSPARLLPRALFTLAGLLLAGPAYGQAHPGPGDWGDAPEASVAYPSLGVAGNFPTFYGGGPAGHWVWHGTQTAFFGPGADQELDGNAGLNLIPPYEQDECNVVQDNDAGLVFPGAHTIQNGVVVSCDPLNPNPPAAIGTTCSTISFGPGGGLEFMVSNLRPDHSVINILFDWNQDGEWGGPNTCSANTDEHAVVNLLVPPGYVGPISGLGAPSVETGPNAGYIWVRVSICNTFEAPLPGWDGSGLFDIGESEDYLLLLDDSSAAEYGDAPDHELAYPNGLIGSFPSCRTVGSNGYIVHQAPTTAWFGPGVDLETDGNASACGNPVLDQDECDYSGGDSGLLIGEPVTIQNGTFSTCTGGAIPGVAPGCTSVTWGVELDIEVTNNSLDDRYLNVLADWDGSGNWGGVGTCTAGLTFLEHVVENLVVPAGFSGVLSQLTSTPFAVGAPPDEMAWMRFSITDAAVPSDWDGSGNFGDGETEDYLLMLLPAATGTTGPVAGRRIQQLQSSPNPFNPQTTIRMRLAESGLVQVEIFDAAGRLVRSLLDEPRDAGELTLVWNGRDDGGQRVTSGVYFARVAAGGEQQTLKMALIE